MQPIKKLPITLLFVFIVLNFVFIYVSVFIFQSAWIAELQKSTSGWIDPNLVTFSLMNIFLGLGLLVMIQSQLNPSLVMQIAGLLLLIIWPLIFKNKFGFFYTLNTLKP